MKGNLGLRERPADAPQSPVDRYALGLHHLAFAAPNREAVDRAAEWARENGCEIDGEPGERDYLPAYYATFFFDPDGIKLEVVHQPHPLSLSFMRGMVRGAGSIAGRLRRRRTVRVGVGRRKWFNRGQPVVGRQLRSAVDALGHESFVLARPKKEKGPRPGALDRDDVWDQPRVTEASAYEIPPPSTTPGSARTGSRRSSATRTTSSTRSRSCASAASARSAASSGSTSRTSTSRARKRAYDVVYSFTRAEQARYAEMGIESPYVPWGCHPELLGRRRGTATRQQPVRPSPRLRLRGRPGQPRAG